jgi:hypothetical protein
MPSKPTALKILELLIDLLSNYQLKSCPYNHCQYRYYRLRSTQIDTISKRKIPQRALSLGPLRTTQTYRQGRSLQHRPLVRQRDTLPFEKKKILVTRKRLSTPTIARKKTYLRKSQSLPAKKAIEYRSREDLLKLRKDIL